MSELVSSGNVDLYLSAINKDNNFDYFSVLWLFGGL